MQFVNSRGSIVRIASCGVALVRHFGGIRFGRDLDGRTGDFIQLILSYRLSFLKDTFVIKIVKGIFDRMPSGHSCTCLFCQKIPFPGDRFPSGAECPFVLAALAKIVPGIFIFLPAGLPITVFIKIVNLIVDLFPFVLRALAVCITSSRSSILQTIRSVLLLLSESVHSLSQHEPVSQKSPPACICIKMLQQSAGIFFFFACSYFPPYIC